MNLSLKFWHNILMLVTCEARESGCFKSKEGLTQVFEVRTTFSQVQRSVVIAMSKAWINGAGNQNFSYVDVQNPLRRGTHFRHAASLVLLKKRPVTRERTGLLDVKAHNTLLSGDVTSTDPRAIYYQKCLYSYGACIHAIKMWLCLHVSKKLFGYHWE